MSWKTQRQVQAAPIIATVTLGCVTPLAMADTPPLRGLNEVNHANVRLMGGFWGRRLKPHREVTIPHALNCLEADGHVTNFDNTAGVYDGPLRGHHAFDSDIYKALEGALYSLQHFRDPELHERVESNTIHEPTPFDQVVDCWLPHWGFALKRFDQNHSPGIRWRVSSKKRQYFWTELICTRSSGECAP